MNDDYASHLPVLEALSALLPMCRVLELGAGEHSTPFWLGLEGLEMLVSVEDDPEWTMRIESKYGDDPRLRLRREMPATLIGFDVVFIDNGGNVPDPKGVREATIRKVLGMEHPPTIIHDAEEPRYHDAIYGSGHNHVTWDRFTPQTALVWR